MPHPTQDREIDDRGVFRFRKNAIVQYLLNSHPETDVNKLAMMPFSDEDRRQFYQLIGYSLCGYLDLFINDNDKKVRRNYDRWLEAAEKERAQKK